jgi:hypothetical protein
MHAVQVGAVRFLGCWAVVDENDILYAAAGDRAVAERLAELIQEHGLLAVPDTIEQEGETP